MKVWPELKKKNCDCVIELDNEKLNELTGGDYPIQKAFSVMSDLVSGIVQSLSEVVTEPSMINVDFADLKKIIEAGGTAKVLYGESDGSDPGSVLDSVLGNHFYWATITKEQKLFFFILPQVVNLQ